MKSMYPPVATKNPAAVEAEVQSAFLTMFPHGDQQFVAQAFDWAGDVFTGNYPDYQAIDAQYHDFEHTFRGPFALPVRCRDAIYPGPTRRLLKGSSSSVCWPSSCTIPAT